MRIRKLRLNNFRNFNSGEVAINDGTTVFYGGVGEGKTNLIEAIFLLSVGRSHRTTENNHLISWGKNEAFIRGEGRNSTGDFSVAINVSKTGKRIELNGIQDTKSIELIGGMRSVIFHSDDIEIVAGGPGNRRKFIDIAISQASKNYAYNLRDYHRILRQRNAALSRFREGNDSGWDEQLATLGSWLTKVRGNVIGEISSAANTLLNVLAGQNKKLEIRYQPTGDEDANKFRTKMGRMFQQDVARGGTSIGPHRDDFRILVDGIDVRYYASSGEKKTIALALKLAEMEFIRSVTGEKPILLLDDVFSTLDVKRSRALLNVTADGAQCIITLTDLNFLKEDFKRGALLYEIKEGNIKESSRI